MSFLLDDDHRALEEALHRLRRLGTVVEPLLDLGRLKLGLLWQAKMVKFRLLDKSSQRRPLTRSTSLFHNMRLRNRSNSLLTPPSSEEPVVRCGDVFLVSIVAWGHSDAHEV